METPLTSLLSGADEYLVPTMAVIPIVLIIVGIILRGTPWIQEWLIPFVLWGIGIAVGVAYDTAPELKHNVANGIVQGSIATGVALMYWRGLKSLLKEAPATQEEPPKDEEKT